MVKKALNIVFSGVVSNPVFIAALVLSFLFYSGIFKLKDRNLFSCLLKTEDILYVEGELFSSPVKSSSSNNYSALFSVKNAYSKSRIKSSAKGNITVFIPESFVEAYFPGKTFTKLNKKSLSKNKDEYFLFEKNFPFKLKVRLFNSEKNFFKVIDATPLSIKKDFFSNIYVFRGLCRLQFKRLMYGFGDAGGLLLSLLSGSREYTDKSVAEGFKNSGLSHILALSGMHLSLFGSIAFFFGNKFTRRSRADFFEMCAIIFFIWFAGLSPSLLRAFLSSLILFVSSILKMKRFEGLSVLSLSFLIHLILRPEDLTSASFMLSYGALCGIMTIGKFTKFFVSKRIFPVLSSPLSDSFGAQLFTAPITISLFSKVMPIGIIASVAVSPIVTVFLYTGLIGTVLSLLVPFLSGLFNVIINSIYFVIINLVMFFSKFPFLDFS